MIDYMERLLSPQVARRVASEAEANGGFTRLIDRRKTELSIEPVIQSLARTALHIENKRESDANPGKHFLSSIFYSSGFIGVLAAKSAGFPADLLDQMAQADTAIGSKGSAGEGDEPRHKVNELVHCHGILGFEKASAYHEMIGKWLKDLESSPVEAEFARAGFGYTVHLASEATRLYYGSRVEAEARALTQGITDSEEAWQAFANG